MDARETMWVTEYGIQPFVLDCRRLKPEPMRPANGREHAMRLAARLAPSKAGVVAFAKRCAPELGDYDPPQILATHGDVPPEFLDQAA